MNQFAVNIIVKFLKNHNHNDNHNDINYIKNNYNLVNFNKFTMMLILINLQ
jgi:hypothetical protein